MIYEDTKVKVTLMPLIGVTELKIGPLVEFVQAGADYPGRLEKKKAELIALYKKVRTIETV